MRTILGGKFESAVISEMDEKNNPRRNRISHPYYLGLNRKCERSYFERASTFLVISEQTFIPLADWGDGPASGSDGVSAREIGIDFNGSGADANFAEHSTEISGIASHIIKGGYLSQESFDYISMLDLSLLDEATKIEVRNNVKREEIAEHYLRRLMLQIREAGYQKCFLVLDERDIAIVAEIGEIIQKYSLNLEFPFPAISDKILDGSNFAGGLFNFAANDAQSVAAIRNNNTIKKYASEVRSHISDASSLEGERALVDAMINNYEHVLKEQKIDKIFEVTSWVLKPLHYVPGLDAALSIAEDAADGINYLVGKDKETREWYLLAAKAQEINITEYLHRKTNLSGKS